MLFGWGYCVKLLSYLKKCNALKYCTLYFKIKVSSSKGMLNGDSFVEGYGCVWHWLVFFNTIHGSHYIFCYYLWILLYYFNYFLVLSIMLSTKSFQFQLNKLFPNRLYIYIYIWVSWLATILSPYFCDRSVWYMCLKIENCYLKTFVKIRTGEKVRWNAWNSV